MPGSLPTVEGDVGTVTTFRPAGAKRDVAVVKVPWQEAGLQLSKAFTECTTLPMPASGAYLLDWRWGLPESIVSDTEFRAQVTRQHYDLTRVINGKAALDLLGGSIPKVTSYLDGPVSAVSLETAWHKLRQALPGASSSVHAVVVQATLPSTTRRCASSAAQAAAVAVVAAVAAVAAAAAAAAVAAAATTTTTATMVGRRLP
jgi:hypothetical protein